MKLFITGIGTEVGKTVVSAILTQAIEADYWKPIQAGDLEMSDTKKVQLLTSTKKTKFHQEAFSLTHPMSPHAAAQRDQVEISLDKIEVPETDNHLIIEGAGGLLVPVNSKDTILDVIQKVNAEVILVSKHYLGSINHTLLSIEALQRRGINIKGIIFNGDENLDTETIILEKTGIRYLGRVAQEKSITKEVVQKYATMFKEVLE